MQKVSRSPLTAVWSGLMKSIPRACLNYFTRPFECTSGVSVIACLILSVRLPFSDVDKDLVTSLHEVEDYFVDVGSKAPLPSKRKQRRSSKTEKAPRFSKCSDKNRQRTRAKHRKARKVQRARRPKRSQSHWSGWPALPSKFCLSKQ